MDISKVLLLLIVLSSKADARTCVDTDTKQFDLTCDESDAVISHVDVIFGRGVCAGDRSCCAGHSPKSIVDKLNCYWKHTCSISFPRDIIIMATDNDCTPCVGMPPEYMILNEYRCITSKIKSAVKPVGIVDICGDDTLNDDDDMSMDSGLLLSHKRFPWIYDSTAMVPNRDPKKVCKKTFWMSQGQTLLVSIHEHIDIAEEDSLLVRAKTGNGTVETKEVQKNARYSEDVTPFVEFEFDVLQGSNGGRGFVLCFKMIPTGDYEPTMNACDMVMTRSEAVKVTQTDTKCMLPFWGCLPASTSQLKQEGRPKKSKCTRADRKAGKCKRKGGRKKKGRRRDRKKNRRKAKSLKRSRRRRKSSASKKHRG